MKLNKILFLLLPLLVQGCSSFFEEKYDKKELFDRVTGLKDIDDSKQNTFMSLDTPYLGKEVDYGQKQKKVLDKEISLTSY